jgi:hypothetical protein
MIKMWKRINLTTRVDKLMSREESSTKKTTK